MFFFIENVEFFDVFEGDSVRTNRGKSKKLLTYYVNYIHRTRKEEINC